MDTGHVWPVLGDAGRNIRFLFGLVLHPMLVPGVHSAIVRKLSTVSDNPCSEFCVDPDLTPLVNVAMMHCRFGFCCFGYLVTRAI